MQNLTLQNTQTQRLVFRKLTGNDFEAFLPFFKSAEANAYNTFDITQAEEKCKTWMGFVFGYT